MKIDKIKKLYPNPITAAQHNNPEEYCVGGACILYHSDLLIKQSFVLDDECFYRFPPCIKLAQALEKINSKLRRRRSQSFFTSTGDYYAKLITISNDRGNFEKAWRYLEEALNYE